MEHLKALAKLARSTPLIEPENIETLAEDARKRANLPRLFPKPMHLARSNGFLLCPVLDGWRCGGAYCDKILRYPPHGSRRQLGYVIYHELAHGLLTRTGYAYSHGDVNNLTQALPVPNAWIVSQLQRQDVHGVVRNLVQLHTHAPVELLRLRVHSVWSTMGAIALQNTR